MLEEGVELEPNQIYQAIARTSSGPTVDDWFTRNATGEFAWTVLPPYGDGGGGVFGENPTISAIEFYVTPFDRWAYDDIEGNVISDLTAGQVIGFAILVNDWDGGHGGLHWVPEAHVSRFPGCNRPDFVSPCRQFYRRVAAVRQPGRTG